MTSALKLSLTSSLLGLTLMTSVNAADKDDALQLLKLSALKMIPRK